MDAYREDMERRRMVRTLRIGLWVALGSLVLLCVFPVDVFLKNVLAAFTFAALCFSFPDDHTWADWAIQIIIIFVAANVYIAFFSAVIP